MQKNLMLNIKNSKGATLIELLVAITLSSLLLMIFFYADYTVKKGIFKWTEKSSVEDAVILLQQQIRKDLLVTQTLTKNFSLNFSLLTKENESIEYLLSDGTLLRNGKAIITSDIIVSNIRFQIFETGRWREVSEMRLIDHSILKFSMEISKGTNISHTLELTVRPWQRRKLQQTRS